MFEFPLLGGVGTVVEVRKAGGGRGVGAEGLMCARLARAANAPVKLMLDRKEEQSTVQKVLQLVPLQHRDGLVLRYYQDLSIEEIAEVLGCSVAAAKVRLHRARQHFKEKYVDHSGEEGRGHEPLP